MKKDLKIFHLQQKIDFINEEVSDDDEEDEDSYVSSHQASDYYESEPPYDYHDGCDGPPMYPKENSDIIIEDDDYGPDDLM